MNANPPITESFLPALEAMVNRFQCPGCVCGSNTKCGKFRFDKVELRCMSHVLGTFSMGSGHFALGLPKGFCKPGWKDNGTETLNKISLRLFAAGTSPSWDNLNVPVWALEQEGYLYVRTYAPRINFSWVDVIEGGTLAMVPQAINVLPFYDSFD
jgi:hypothetical protein